MEPPPVRYVTTADGFSIAYCVSGEGVPFVLMPNIWNHIQLFWRTPLRRPLYEALAGRFRLVQFDTRGQGLSTRGLGEDHTRESYDRDLEAVVDRLTLARFVVCARGIFAATAIHYALRHPECVEALILDNPETELPSNSFDQLMHENWDMFVETIARLSGNPEDPATLVPLFRQCVSQPDFIAMSQAWRRAGPKAALEQIRTPTLVLASQRSPLASRERAARVASMIPEARYVILDHPGFYSPDTPPVFFAIEEFIASLGIPEMSAGQETSSQLEALSSLPASPLSAREVEVLRLVTQGKTNRQIAEELVISERTVINHLSHIFIKTGAENRAGATAYALRHGLA